MGDWPFSLLFLLFRGFITACTISNDNFTLLSHCDCSDEVGFAILCLIQMRINDTNSFLSPRKKKTLCHLVRKKESPH